MRPVWTLVLFNQLTATPAYDAAHAYFPIEGDRFVSYTLPAGTRVWTIAARLAQPPVAGGGFVFLVEADALTARRASDGSIAWRASLAEALAVRPTFDNGWLIAASTSGDVLAYRATDGALIWRRSLAAPAHAPAALADDRVYLPTSDSHIVAMRVESGEPIWERRLGGAPNEILALSERLYAGSVDNFFYCLMTRDGRIDWRWRTGGDVVGEPIADDRRVYFVALDNVLRAMDQKSGAQIWMRPLPIRPIAGPVRAGSTILVAGQPAQLRAFSSKDGTPVPGEPIVPGVPGAAAPAPPPRPITATYARGVDIPHVDLAPELTDAMPHAIPPEIDLHSEGETAAKAATIASDPDMAAPPHVIEDPTTRLPMLVMITKEIARGAGVTLVTRSFEPPLAPVSPLPNMIQIAPQTPPTPAPPRR